MPSGAAFKHSSETIQLLAHKVEHVFQKTFPGFPFQSFRRQQCNTLSCHTIYVAYAKSNLENRNSNFLKEKPNPSLG